MTQYWLEKDSAEYAQIMERLKEVGCPVDLIKDIGISASGNIKVSYQNLEILNVFNPRTFQLVNGTQIPLSGVPSPQSIRLLKAEAHAEKVDEAKIMQGLYEMHRIDMANALSEFFRPHPYVKEVTLGKKGKNLRVHFSCRFQSGCLASWNEFVVLVPLKCVCKNVLPDTEEIDVPETMCKNIIRETCACLKEDLNIKRQGMREWNRHPIVETIIQKIIKEHQDKWNCNYSYYYGSVYFNGGVRTKAVAQIDLSGFFSIYSEDTLPYFKVKAGHNSDEIFAYIVDQVNSQLRANTAVADEGRAPQKLKNYLNQLKRSCALLYFGEHAPSADFKIKYKIYKGDWSRLTYVSAFAHQEAHGNLVYTKAGEEMNALLKSKLFQRCRKEAETLISGFSGGILYKSGEGILFGETCVELQTHNFSIPYTIQVPSWKESVPNWRKALKKAIKDMEEALVKKEVDLKNKFVQQYSAARLSYSAKGVINFFSSELYRDIVETVRLNEKYITENAVAQILRGTKVGLNTTIVYPEEAGRYNCFDNEKIRIAIRQLQGAGLMTSTTLKGTYGRYDILKMTEKGRLFLVYFYFAEIKPKIDGNDREFEEYFERKVKKEPVPSAATCISMLDAAKRKEFIAFNRELYINYLSSAPDEFFTYLKMRIQMETDAFAKKVLKELMETKKD